MPVWSCEEHREGGDHAETPVGSTIMDREPLTPAQRVEVHEHLTIMSNSITAAHGPLATRNPEVRKRAWEVYFIHEAALRRLLPPDPDTSEAGDLA